MKYLSFIIVVFAFVGVDAFFTWNRIDRTIPQDCMWTEWVEEDCIRFTNATMGRRETRFKIPARNGGRECVGADLQTIKPCTHLQYYAQTFMKTFAQGMIDKAPATQDLGLFRLASGPDRPEHACSTPVSDPDSRWRMSGRSCKPISTKRRKRDMRLPEEYYRSKRQTRDVLFLIDESGSVGAENFKKILKFVEAMISKLCAKIKISPRQTKVALTTFDSQIHDKIKFNDFSAGEDVITRIRNINYSSRTDGSTCLGNALQHTRTKVFNATHGARKSAGVYGMIILISDGCANCDGNLEEEVQALRENQITFMLVTVGDRKGCAQKISKMVEGDHCYLNYEMDNWNDFDKFIEMVKNEQDSCYWIMPKKSCDAEM